MTCKEDPLCHICGPEGLSCQDCFEAYTNLSGVCIKPRESISYCKVYANEKACRLCYGGYYPDAKGICVPITIPNCNALESNKSRCRVCRDGILVNNGKCEDLDRRCSLSNCQLCNLVSNLESCEKCADPFLLAVGFLGMSRCIERTHETRHCQAVHLDLQGEIAYCSNCASDLPDSIIGCPEPTPISSVVRGILKTIHLVILAALML